MVNLNLKFNLAVGMLTFYQFKLNLQIHYIILLYWRKFNLNLLYAYLGILTLYMHAYLLYAYLSKHA
jgi:hypothetical protein